MGNVAELDAIAPEPARRLADTRQGCLALPATAYQPVGMKNERTFVATARAMARAAVLRAVSLAAGSLAMVSLAACTPPAGAAPPLEPADFVLGGVPMEADSVEIRLSFGDPDSVVMTTNPYDAGAPLESWYYYGLVIHYDGEATPASYVVTGGDEGTARGVRTGDSIARVLERYGDPDYRNDAVWTYVDPSPDGELYVLEFLVQDDVVVRIHVGRVDQ
jgi:hypothetical protein